jgi:hypothetical protein
VSLPATSLIWAPQQAASCSMLPAGCDPLGVNTNKHVVTVLQSAMPDVLTGCGTAISLQCSARCAGRTVFSLRTLLQVPFRQTVEGLLPRPWAVDNLDAALNALTRLHPHVHAIACVDNAGSDAVLGIHSLIAAVSQMSVVMSANTPMTAGHDLRCLPLAGMLPFARELLRRGTRVTLAANETPSINDITAAELQQVQD